MIPSYDQSWLDRLPLGLIAQACPPIVSLISLTLITRHLGLSQYGEYILLKSFLELSVNVFSIRANEISLKYFPYSASYIKSLLPISLTTSIFSIIIAFIMFSLQEGAQSLLSVIAIPLLLYPISFQLNEMLNGVIRYKSNRTYFIFQITENIFKPILLIISINKDLSIFQFIVYVAVVPNITILLIKIYYNIETVKTIIYSPIKIKELKRLWGDIKNFMASGIVKSISNRIDNYLVYYWSSPEALGTYQVIKSLLSPLSILSSAVTQTELPKIFRNFREGNDSGNLLLIKKKTGLILISTISAVIIIYFLRDFIWTILNTSQPEQSITTPFFLIATMLLLSSVSWWTSAYFVFYFPYFPKYTNTLLAINNIIIPISLKYVLNGHLSILVIISISRLAAFLPSYMWGLRKAYTKMTLHEK